MSGSSYKIVLVMLVSMHLKPYCLREGLLVNYFLNLKVEKDFVN